MQQREQLGRPQAEQRETAREVAEQVTALVDDLFA